MRTSETIEALAEALVAVQPKLQHPKKNAINPHLKNKFADLNCVIDANRETLSGAGLVIVQTPHSDGGCIQSFRRTRSESESREVESHEKTVKTGDKPEKQKVPASKASKSSDTAEDFAITQISVTTRLIHKSGQWIEDTVSVPLEGQKGLNLSQAAGSIITYLRRYGWQTILGINGEPDNDGSDGKTNGTKKPQQADRSKPVDNDMLGY